LPALNVTFAPARWANIRMSISLPFIFPPRRFKPRNDWQHLYAKSWQPRASFASTRGAMIPGRALARRLPGTLRADHCGGTIMATVTTIERRQLDGSLPAPRARIGMIIPSVNSMTDRSSTISRRPTSACMSRARGLQGSGSGRLRSWPTRSPRRQSLPPEGRPIPSVFPAPTPGWRGARGGGGKFHKTGGAPPATGGGARSRLVLEALQALGLRNLVLLSPYKSNQAVIDYL